MKKFFTVAVVGGHGLVATRIIKDLETINFPISKLIVYGSPQNILRPLVIDGKSYEIRTIDTTDIPHFDVVFFSGSDDLVELYGKFFIEKGAKIIDNSSFYRMDSSVPLVIPEINSLDLLDKTSIYANPNCSTIMMLLAIAPLADHFGLERINVSTYQSASGMGKAALENFLLEQQTTDYVSGYFPHKSVTKKSLADNILPIIGEVDAFSFYTGEEIKMREESQKILHNPDLEVSATCVRVPTTIGHAAAVQAIFKEKVDLDVVKKLLLECSWIMLKEKEDYPDLMQVRHTGKIQVGRLRVDKDCEYTLHLFVTSDNLHRGASYNAVLIAQRLMELGVI